MELWKIGGGKALSGSVTVPGAKSALLPILAATLLTGGETELTNCPNLPAVDDMLEVLRSLGCTAHRQDDVLSIDTRGLTRWELPAREDIPAKALLLSSLLARCGRVRLPVSGSPLLWEREVDIPLFVLRALGARASREEGALLCTAEGGLTGGAVSLPVPDVTATLCAVTAACAEGDTVFMGTARLRLKESDLVQAVTDLLAAVGIESEAGADHITVHGCGGHIRGTLAGSPVDSLGDHRMAMAAAIAGVFSREGVSIRNPWVTDKSYPGFYNDLIRLGGTIDGSDVR